MYIYISNALPNSRILSPPNDCFLAFLGSNICPNAAVDGAS